MEKIKDLEHQGYQFEGADASLELLLREAFGEMKEIFKLESLKMLVEKTNGGMNAEAIVKVNVDGEPSTGGGRQRPGQRAQQRAAQGARAVLSEHQRFPFVRL